MPLVGSCTKDTRPSGVQRGLRFRCWLVALRLVIFVGVPPVAGTVRMLRASSKAMTPSADQSGSAANAGRPDQRLVAGSVGPDGGQGGCGRFARRVDRDAFVHQAPPVGLQPARPGSASGRRWRRRIGLPIQGQHDDARLGRLGLALGHVRLREHELLPVRRPRRPVCVRAGRRAGRDLHGLRPVGIDGPRPTQSSLRARLNAIRVRPATRPGPAPRRRRRSSARGRGIAWADELQPARRRVRARGSRSPGPSRTGRCWGRRTRRAPAGSTGSRPPLTGAPTRRRATAARRRRWASAGGDPEGAAHDEQDGGGHGDQPRQGDGHVEPPEGLGVAAGGWCGRPRGSRGERARPPGPARPRATPGRDDRTPTVGRHAERSEGWCARLPLGRHRRPFAAHAWRSGGGS